MYRVFSTESTRKKELSSEAFSNASEESSYLVLLFFVGWLHLSWKTSRRFFIFCTKTKEICTKNNRNL